MFLKSIPHAADWEEVPTMEQWCTSRWGSRFPSCAGESVGLGTRQSQKIWSPWWRETIISAFRNFPLYGNPLLSRQQVSFFSYFTQVTLPSTWQVCQLSPPFFSWSQSFKIKCGVPIQWIFICKNLKKELHMLQYGNLPSVPLTVGAKRPFFFLPMCSGFEGIGTPFWVKSLKLWIEEKQPPPASSPVTLNLDKIKWFARHPS